MIVENPMFRQFRTETSFIYAIGNGANAVYSVMFG